MKKMRQEPVVAIVFALFAVSMSCMCQVRGKDTYLWTGNVSAGHTITNLECYRVSYGSTGTDYVNATTLPQDGDELGLTSHSVMYVSTTNAAEMEIFSRVRRLFGIGADSKLFVDVPSGTNYVLSAGFFYSASEHATSASRGTLVKQGGGDLWLTGSRLDSKGTTDYAYNGNIDIREGSVHAKTNAPGGVAQLFGIVTIASNATFYTCRNDGSTSSLLHTAPWGLQGDGLVTNDSPLVSSINWILRPSGTNLYVFGGQITAPVRLFCYGFQDFTGTNNTMSAGITIFYENHGGLGVTKIGNSGEPSSIGKSAQIAIRDYGGKFRYLGTGETTSKNVNARGLSGYNTVIDGGPHGGLVLTGEWTHRNDTAARNSVVFTGSHTNPCEFAGATSSSHQSLYPFDFTKSGPGMWIMRHNANRSSEGVFNVTEGALQFDSIDRKYEKSALGTAAMPLDGYAHYLGGDSGEVLFEYIGTAPRRAGDRPMAIAGDVRIRTAGGRLQLSSATCTAAKTVTLTLDGTNEEENVLYSVSDGTAGGKINLVKEGTGRWILTGNQSFSGTLTVKQGTLTVRKHAYNWFKWLVKSNRSSNTTMAGAAEFALYDANNVRQNANLAFYTNKIEKNTMYLKPGEMDYDRRYSYIAYSDGDKFSRNIDQLVNGTASQWNYRAIDDVVDYELGDTNAVTKLDWSASNPRTWAHVVMRLKEGAPQIASYDWMCSYAESSSSNSRNVKEFQVLGSTDGCNWELLDERDYPTSPVVANNSWVFAGGSAFTDPHVGGCPIATRPAWVDTSLSNVSGVRVDAGASLTAEGDGPFPLNGLVVDVSSGIGVIDGFAFAETGEIVLLNVPRDSVSMPAALAGASGLDYVNSSAWTVKNADGSASRCKVHLSKTSVSVLVEGLSLIFR